MHEAVDKLASFVSIERERERDEILQSGIELPTFSLRFGYLSTAIQ